MPTSAAREIISDLAQEVGPDAAFFRKERDRLYLTGIEIAILIATGVLTSFLTGLFSGVKKRLNKYGEILGQEVVDRTIGELSGLRRKLEKIDAQKTEQAKKQIDEIQSELDRILSLPELKKIGADNLRELRGEITQEVKAYLQANGFPEDTAKEDAEKFVDRVQGAWDDEISS